MDIDIAYQDILISDTVLVQFPEYSFSEARSKAYGLSIQCEFGEEGLANREKLQSRGMKISESSKYLLCRHDSQKNTLDSFQDVMSKYQLASHIVHLNILRERVDIWKDFENSKISLSSARVKNESVVSSLEMRLNKKFNELRLSN